MYQIGSNVTRILQNLTVFGYLLSIARVLVLEASPPFLHPLVITAHFAPKWYS